MGPETAVRVLAVPVFKRYWLWHGWKVAAPVSNTPPKPWQQGKDLQEKAQLFLAGIQRWGSKQAEQQWHKLSTAPEGTFNHKLFRLAQEVMSRVEPNESFLKVLPQQADSFELRYPASLPERLVRRRLRLLAAKAQPFHASRLRVWALALVPQLPLIPLPLPNVTIYFTIWRIISNRSAANGAASLWQSLQHLSDVQRSRLAQQLLALQQQGVPLRPGTWSAQLAADAARLQQQVQPYVKTAPSSASSSSTTTTTTSSSSSSPAGQEKSQPASAQQQKQGQQQQQDQQQQQQQQQLCLGLPVPVFTPDQELDRLVAPGSRYSEFLPESVVDELVQLYQQPHLLEHYRAARKTCGSPGSKAPY